MKEQREETEKDGERYIEGNIDVYRERYIDRYI